MRAQPQFGKPGPYGPATSHFPYPKPPLGSFTTAVGFQNQNPQNGQLTARFAWGLGAVCCGASPVASALDLPQKRDLPENRFQTTMPSSGQPSKQDISTLHRIGHFYFALTGQRANVSAQSRNVRFAAKYFSWPIDRNRARIVLPFPSSECALTSRPGAVKAVIQCAGGKP